jgi:peptidoglycan/LPS O-acetylase OafA/YrhL
MIVHLLLLKNQSYWYNTSLAFLTGILYAIYKDSLKKYFSRFRIALLLVAGTILGGVVFATLQGFNPGWLQIICSELCVILVLTLEHCTILRSRLLSVIGAASWEIFLIHQLVYSAYYSVCKDFYGLSGILCIVIAVVSGILICSFDQKLVSHIDKAFYSFQTAISPVRK